MMSPRLRDDVRVWRDRLARLKPLAWPVCIMTGVYALGISAILRADFYYMDDLERALLGYKGWGNVSRYLSDILSTFVHADDYLSDVSPLPQLIACLLLALSSVIVLYLITGRKRFNFWEYAAVLPLGLSPYMLECLSYKFDSPYMALSVLASVAPLLAVRAGRPGWLLAVSSALGTLAMCCSYQAASGILPMLAALLAFRMWLQGRPWRETLRFVLFTAAGYCAAIVFYKLVLVRPTPMDYASSSITALSQLVPHAADALGRYFSAIFGRLNRSWLILIGLICAGFVWTAVRDTARNRLASLLLALVCLALLALLSFGLYPLLEKVLIHPRSMYGFGAAVAFIAVSAAAARKALPAKLVCFALSWCFFVFAFTYGNALSSQKVYTEFRVEEVIDALKTEDSSLYEPEDAVMVQLRGDIGHPPSIRRTMREFPILKDLVPLTFGDSGQFGYYGFACYYGLPGMTSTVGSDIDLRNFHLPLLDETIYHTIYGNAQFLLIELK